MLSDGYWIQKLEMPNLKLLPILIWSYVHILPIFTVVENRCGISVVDVKENVLCSIVIEVLQDENIAVLRGHIQVEEETGL